MIKLYGLPVSNYYNVVKLAMLEKGVPFEEVTQRPNQDPSYLAISPLGKMPCVVTPEGSIAETLAILEYLEARYPEVSLYPSDPMERARAMQIHCMINTTLDAAVRQLIAQAYFGAPRTEFQIQEMNTALAKGCAGLARLTDFSKFAAGDSFSHADLAAVNTMLLASGVPAKLGQTDPIMELPGFKDYLQRMEAREHVKAIRADQMESLRALTSR